MCFARCMSIVGDEGGRVKGDAGTWEGEGQKNGPLLNRVTIEPGHYPDGVQGWRGSADRGNIRDYRSSPFPEAEGAALMRRFLPLHPDAALLILRVVLGVIMLYHGWPKLTNLGGTIEGFSGMGVPLPALSAVFATVAEVGGGLLLLFGVLTDVAGLLIAVDMLGAIVFVHAKNGFAVNEGGIEWPLALMAMALAIALAGPGRYSVGSRV